VTPGPLEGRNAIKQTWQKELARCLASQVWVGAMQSISHTAVPVIKLTTRRQGGQRKREDYEGVATASAARDRLSPPVSPSWGGSLPAVHVDISFEDQMHNGQASNELLLSLIDEFPALRPLVLVLKQFLKERGLCVSYTGGLTSYAVVLMVARYLQEQATHLDAGSLLLGFLDFYGNTFDPRSTGISVARCCYFSRLSPLPPAPGPRMYYPSDAVARRAYRVSEGGNMALPYQFDPLYIEDPLAAENNVGRNCFRIWQIKRAWSEAHSGLLSAMDAPGNGESLLSVLCSLGGKGGRSSTPVASAAAPPAV
jgi:DNA polymerase sigma